MTLRMTLPNCLMLQRLFSCGKCSLTSSQTQNKRICFSQKCGLNLCIHCGLACSRKLSQGEHQRRRSLGSGSRPESSPGRGTQFQAGIASDGTAGTRAAAAPTAIASSGETSREEDYQFVRPLLPGDELRRASYNLALSCCADSPHAFLMEKSAQSEASAFAVILGSLSKVQSAARARSVAHFGFAAVQSSSVPFIRGFMVALSVSLQNQALMSTVWPQLQRLCEAVCWILR